MAGHNLSYLDKGRVAAKAEHVADFATALAERIGAERRTAILAYPDRPTGFVPLT